MCKRILTFLLLAALILSSLPIIGHASGFSCCITLTPDAESYFVGDIVTLSLCLDRTDSDLPYSLYNFTDLLAFDNNAVNYIGYDADSLSEGFILDSGTDNTGLKYSKNLKFISLRYQHIDPFNTPKERAASLPLVKLKFKLIKEGDTSIFQNGVEVWASMFGDKGERVLSPTLKLTATPVSPISPIPSGNVTPPPKEKVTDSDVSVKVGETSYKVESKKVSDSQLEVLFDKDIIAEIISDTGNEIHISAKDNSESEHAISAISATIPAESISVLSDKNMSLKMDVGQVELNLPVSSINSNPDGVLSDSVLSVSLTSSEKIPDKIISAIEKTGAEIISPAFALDISIKKDDKSTPLPVLGKYAVCTLQLTETEARKITTAVAVEKDGSTRHIPTYVYKSSDKWYVKVSLLTESSYVFIHNDLKFEDADGWWYESAANEVSSRRIITGTENNSFEGNRSITRAEFATVLIRALGLPANGKAGIFPDIPENSWCSGSIGKAYELKLVNGRETGVFDAKAPLTRQEAMTMAFRAAQLIGFTGSSTSLESFADKIFIRSWAEESIKFSVGSGLILGDENNMLRPEDKITRAETAVLLIRLLQKSQLIDKRIDV